jgi:PIN domain
MMSSAEAVRRIMTAQAPVLLPDTCSLLDLMRDPRREAFSAEQVLVARRLLIRAESRPRTLWLPIADQVLAERHEHQLNVKQEAETAIRKLEECVNHVQRTMAAHGLITSEIAPSLSASNFPDTASTLVDRYFSAGMPFQRPRNVADKALARVAANKAPSRKGRQAKDCVVIESYLHIAKQLREQQFQCQIVFLTTNKQDYSDHGQLHPDLVDEFHAVNMKYAVNFPMAEHLLG